MQWASTLVTIVVIVFLWVILQKWILPKMGIST